MPPFPIARWLSQGFSRRTLLHDTALGLTGLALPGLLRMRALAADRTAGGNRNGNAPATPDTAAIFVTMGGGPSQFETWDPKPDAPLEYRGAFRPIATNVPGVQFCELFPQLARQMDRCAVVRSLHHHEASHIAEHLVETGYFLQSSQNARRGEMPSMGAVVSKLRSGERPTLPRFVSIPKPHAYSGAHFLGSQHNFLAVDDDPSAASFQVKNLTLLETLTAQRLRERGELRQSFDTAEVRSSEAAALDEFTQQAMDLLLGEQAQAAFALDRESDATRDRYGRTTFGQRLLLARRLVEAGVPFVVVRTFDWDDHEALGPKMQARCPGFDQALATLIDDLAERGLSQRVLVTALGEFGRTPRVNPKGGRDHWPGLGTALLAGGNYRMGQIIGASDDKGAAPAAAPYAPQSVLAMVYRHLGIDPGLTFEDFAGRPRYILEERTPIAELLG